jgi:CheY-like chemotaxis protein
MPQLENKVVTILLVEDEPAWQDGIEALLSGHPPFQLVDKVDNYDAALEAFTRLEPDWVLLDWKIKGERDGLAVGAALVEKGFDPHRIVLISGSPVTSIPKHSFWSVGKAQIASELLPLLENVTKACKIV